MRQTVLATALIFLIAVTANNLAWAQTCADQHRACLARGHTAAECTTSTNRCLQTGRWIGPAGNEYPIAKKK